MRLTPLDITHKEFKRGLRGYSEQDVDGFLDEVAAEYEKLFQENIDLSERVDRLQKKLEQYENFEQALQQTMLAAQRSAEEIQENARKTAELHVQEAEYKARAVLQQGDMERRQLETELMMLRQMTRDFKEKLQLFFEAQLAQLREIEAQAARLPESQHNKPLPPVQTPDVTSNEVDEILEYVESYPDEEETPSDS